MLDIGWTELLVVAIVLIVVVGPKELPNVLRTFGKTMTSLRRMATDFRSQVDHALKEADMEDVSSALNDVRKLNPANSIRDAMNPLRETARDLKKSTSLETPSAAKKTATEVPKASYPTPGVAPDTSSVEVFSRALKSSEDREEAALVSARQSDRLVSTKQRHKPAPRPIKSQTGKGGGRGRKA